MCSLILDHRRHVVIIDFHFVSIIRRRFTVVLSIRSRLFVVCLRSHITVIGGSFSVVDFAGAVAALLLVVCI